MKQEDLELLKEANVLKSDIFILMWEMSGILEAFKNTEPEFGGYKKHIEKWGEESENIIEKMLKQLDKDFNFISELIKTLSTENETNI